MRLLRSVYRSALLVALLLAATADLFLRRPQEGAEGAVWIHRWCRRIVCAIGIECSVTGPLPGAGAVVSNHLSYLDILLYSAAQPFAMVAKSEVRSWPLLGRLTARAGTVYVDRGAGASTYATVNRAMAEAYKTGLPVLFFPEGTTTDGAAVLPFRRGLFHSVLNERVGLRTAAICYSISPANAPATVANAICWWGDDLFAPHIVRCLGLSEIRARICFAEHAVEGDDRFSLSENAHALVDEAYSGLQQEMAHDREMAIVGLDSLQPQS